MPIKKYRIDTDKGSFEVEVEEPESIPHFSGVGATDESGRPLDQPHEPDTYWGGFRKGFAESLKPDPGKLRGMFQSLAQPESLTDIAGLALPSAALGMAGREARGFMGAGKNLARAGGEGMAGKSTKLGRFGGMLKGMTQEATDATSGRDRAFQRAPLHEQMGDLPTTDNLLQQYQAGGRSPASPSPLGAKVPVEGMVGEGSSAPAASLSPMASHLQPEGPRPPIETDEFPHGLVSHSFHRSIGDLNQGMRAGQPGPLDELLLRILREGK